MIEDTLARIEARITGTESLTEDRQKELLELVGKLRAEVSELSKTDQDRAQSIAGFAQLSAHEATRTEKDPRLLDISLRGLGSSVGGFEQSHPQLVQIVNSISHTLANLGI